MFVDFTAAWCITCKFNEASVLETAAVRDAFRAHAVTKLRADWTNGDPVITKLLQHFGRPGVPLYVLYPGKDIEPIVFPELLTKGMVLDKLENVTHRIASIEPLHVEKIRSHDCFTRRSLNVSATLFSNSSYEHETTLNRPYIINRNRVWRSIHPPLEAPRPIFRRLIRKEKLRACRGTREIRCARMVQSRVPLREEALRQRQHAEAAERIHRQRRCLAEHRFLSARGRGQCECGTGGEDHDGWKAHQTALVLDPDGKVGRAYGAKNTPHMFVINPEGKVVYEGAIDSKPTPNPADIPSSTNYVKQALDEALAGKPLTTPDTKPYGCSVKYKSS